MSRIQHRLHAVVYPSRNLPGEWVSHCLELDLMSQGSSAHEAINLLVEAISLSAQWAMEEGLPPLEMKSAPPEAWKLYHDTPHGSDLIRIIRLPSADDTDVVIEPAIARAG